MTCTRLRNICSGFLDVKGCVAINWKKGVVNDVIRWVEESRVTFL